MKGLLLLSLLLATCTLGMQVQYQVYLLEEFEDRGSVISPLCPLPPPEKSSGYSSLTRGLRRNLQTSEDAKFYALSTRLKLFSNEKETLVAQFSVKHEQGIDCGGGCVKLFPDSLNQEDMLSESEYYILFGPDICGFGNTENRSSLHYQGKYHGNNKTIKCRINKDTHLYILIICPNATYEVKIDNKQVAAGDLEENWNFLPPRKIKDLYAQKPRKWDEHLQREDSEDKKPEDRGCLPGKEDWEDFEYIPDPDTKKPDDWNEVMDEEWEGPLIPNLKYKVKSGSIFENFLLTSDEEFAEEVGNKTWGIRKDVEKQWRELFEEMVKRKQEEEAKKKREKEEEREDDIWGIEEEGNEEDFSEEPGNDKQMKEVDAERAFLGKKKEVHVDRKDEP